MAAPKKPPDLFHRHVVHRLQGRERRGYRYRRVLGLLWLLLLLLRLPLLLRLLLLLLRALLLLRLLLLLLLGESGGARVARRWVCGGARA